MRSLAAALYRVDARLEHITSTCAYLCDVPIEKIYARRREPQYVFARQLAFFIARRAGYSLPQIGSHYQRDHTTVLYGIRKVEQAIATHPDLARIAEGAWEYVQVSAA